MRAARVSAASPSSTPATAATSHPTQTLTGPAHHPASARGRLAHLTIGFCGDLKYGRTVHSAGRDALARLRGQ